MPAGQQLKETRAEDRSLLSDIELSVCTKCIRYFLNVMFLDDVLTFPATSFDTIASKDG